MYWVADRPANTTNPALIRMSAIDGAGASTIPVTTPLGQIHGLSVDTIHSNIYISTTRDLLSGAPTGIGRIPLAGGAYTPLFTHTSGFVGGLEVDPVAGKVYAALNLFDALANPDRRIVRMNLDGSNFETLYTITDAEFGLEDLELDVPRNRLVVVHSGNIAVGSLDGTAGLQIIDTVGTAYDIALSADGQSMFYSDILTNRIHSINFDGTGDTLLRSGYKAFAVESLVPEPATVLLAVAAVGWMALRRVRN
jgi:hypothetical protein